jgi:DNA-binding NarL/FixJ family response regulator
VEAPPVIRVLLVDDHQMILDGLTAMLRSHSGRVEVVGQTTDAGDALRLARLHTPDVILLDVRMKKTSGLDLCQELVTSQPDSKVVLLTVYDDQQYLFQGLRAGAAGYLTKQVSGAELVAHLERVMAGEVVIDAALAGRVALSAARLHSGEYWPGANLGLTQRESEVLELMVRGLSNRAIANRLIVGEETVKTHVRNIYRKLNAVDRSQAVTAAIREGLFL